MKILTSLTVTLALQRRFWTKVNMFPDECWLWTAAIAGSGTGYGYFRVEGRTVRANRVAWILTYGDIPEGMGVLHTCDNTWCVNPAHLWLGDQLANHTDKKEKGRTSHLCGEDSGMAKVTEAQVRLIRLMYAGGGWSHRRLGRLFGLSHTTIDHMLRRINWPHVA